MTMSTGRSLGDIYGRAQQTAPSGVQAAIDMANRMGINARDPRGNTRIGTQAELPPGVAAAAQAMGIPLSAQQGFGHQPVAQGGSAGVPTQAVGNAATQLATDNQRIAPGTPAAAAANPSGYAPQQIGGGDPNQHQMTTQAQAMIAEIMRRQAQSQGQRMVEDRGVYGGQQQAAAQPPMPPMALPQLFSGGTVMPPPPRRA